MKCKCGLEMERWQSSLVEGELVNRYRCICGQEKAEFTERTKATNEKAKETKETKG
jgi:hypothetical protein